MLRVGLTGGLASGKSHVGALLQTMGCHLLKADQLGHDVLLPAGEAYEGVVAAFGPGILDEQGLIARRKLASEVFDHPDRLALLNSLVHPPVLAREERWFREITEADPDGIGIVEAAILIETGSYRRFARLILTVCRPEQQVERAMKRDGLSREDVEARLRRQMPLEEKRKFAHFIVDTAGTREETAEQVREVFEQLRNIR